MIVGNVDYRYTHTGGGGGGGEVRGDRRRGTYMRERKEK